VDITSDLNRCEDIEVHLTARCGRLLQVWHPKSPSPKSEIQYLHRTVQEYITRSHVWRLLIARTSPSAFNTELSLIKILVLRICINWQTRRQSRHLQLAFQTLVHAREAERAAYKATPMLLDRLDSLASTFTSDGKFTYFLSTLRCL